MKGDRIAFAGLALASALALASFANSYLLTVEHAAKPFGYSAKTIGWVLVWKQIEERWHSCEQASAIWYRKMNQCLGDLSTACFDPKYCEGMRAAAHSAELIELEEKRKHGKR